MRMEKKGQVWVETVIYTLIAFIMIGAVLAFVKPKIEEFQDRAIVEQTLTALEDLNSVIFSVVQGGPGNKRVVEMGIKKGFLEIRGDTETLFFEVDSKYTYSEPGSEVSVGSANILTQKKGKGNLITIVMNYSNRYNLTYQGSDENKVLTKAAIPYKIAIYNNGTQTTTNASGDSIVSETQIDFKIV